MKKISNFVFLLAAVEILSAQPPNGAHIPGRLLVQQRFGVNSNAAAQALANAGARIEGRINALNVSILRIPEAATDRIAAALLRTGNFTFVEQDFPAFATLTPNDPQYGSQWHLSKIQASSAWNLTTGAAGVPIAVLDTGVELTHPDLAAKILPGWNFVTGTSNTADTYGHGTKTSGAAAAATDNLTGVAGVGWKNLILPVVIADSTGYSSYSLIASGITYAADHGARVISVSYAGTVSSSTLQSAVNYAWSKGAVVVASAGNYSTSTPYYPAACNYALSVGATDSYDKLASFSNYGSWVDVVAPGVSVLTTSMGGSYSSVSGTSFSAPITAGVLALMVSENPTLSAANLVSLLEQSADDLGALGFDTTYGYGRVNAYKALQAAQAAPSADTTAPTVSISSPANGAIVASTIQIQGTASDNVGVASIQLFVDGLATATASSSPFAFSWNTSGVANGAHTVTVKAQDAAGNVGSASIGLSVQNGVSTTPDVVPPSVLITNPIGGSTISKPVSIVVSATDNVGVSQVVIYVDTTLLCTTTSTPYSCSWNPKKATSGSHTIKAVAYDAAQNSASNSVTVLK